MFEELQSQIRRINQVEMAYWSEYDFLSVRWWAIVILSILFLLLLFMLIDRSRILHITVAFFVSFFLVGIVNELGYFFGLWSYPHQFIPSTKTMNAVDFITVPVILTLLYQYFSKWKYFLYANVIVFLFIGYVIVPLFVYFKFYILYNWNYTLSFITLLIVSILVKIIVDWIYKKSQAHRSFSSY